MKKIIFMFVSIFFLFNTVFGSNASIENIIYNYLNAIQSEDINWIKSNFKSFDDKRLQLYAAVFKSINQKFSNVSIEKVQQDGNKALVEVKFQTIVMSKVNSDSFEENSDLIFLLEKISNKWYIVKIVPYEDFNIIVKSFFLKEFAKSLNKDENAIQKIGYNTAESGENFLDNQENYIGCYKDQGDPQGLTGRDLNGFIFHSNNMTPQMCINLCAQKGFKYAGVQYSSYCFCGNSYGKYGVANNCNMKCSGDQNQICGGTWANSIYLATNITSPETNINGKTNLIKNGSFELGPQHVGSWLTLSKGSNKINNWAITNGSIDLIENYWQSSNGKRSIDLCGSTCGAISQNINTVPGATYQLTFDLAGNPDNQGIKYLKVIAGSISKTFQFNTTGKNKRNMGWVKKSLTFTATSNITNISFIALDNNPSAWGPAIDNVKIVRISNINTSNNINNPALTTINVAGSWDTNFGKMNLIQRGNTVTGSYTHDKGRITGTISGNILIGRWSEYPSYKPPRDAGDLQFVFSKDGTKFTGKWRYGFCGNTWDGTWNGTKISTNSANPEKTNFGNSLNDYFKNSPYAENWFKNWNVIKTGSLPDGTVAKIAGVNNRFGWYYPVKKIGDAMPPEGAHGAALYLHPISTTEPTHLKGKYYVNSKDKSLMFRVAGNKNGDWLMEVRINGVKAFERVIDGKKWYELTIPLQKYYGQTIDVDLYIKANGWYFEYAFIDEIKFINTQYTENGFEYSTDRPGYDYKNFDLQQNNALLCKQACDNDPKCKAWTFVKPGYQGPNPRCWLKYAVPNPVLNTFTISGVKKENPQNTNHQPLSKIDYHDDFNFLNKDFWLPLEWQTLRYAPNKIYINNGILDLKCNYTDRSGFLASKAIKINKGDIITIKRRVKVHYANQYFEGGIWFYQTDNPDLTPAANLSQWSNKLGRFLFQVTYYNYYYEKPGVTQYVPTKHGFVIAGYDWRNKQNYKVFQPIWDRWFEEEIVYDSDNNIAIYKINGQTAQVYTADLTSPYIRFIMHSYGWYTGHDIQVDWIDIKVHSKNNTNITNTVNTSNNLKISDCGLYQFKGEYIPKLMPETLNPNIKKVYLTCAINNVPKDTEIVAQWYCYQPNGEKLFIANYPYRITNDNYSGYITYYLEMPPEKTWPQGKYEIILTNKGLPLKTINFNMK
ncbi:choice-of-anchor C family protein [Deferribacter thermophilus]|uniref:choice-of-anchor C family protein n=1 Tax=Deferribacter thermophilus TaxID=53573 RepID=UPI003C25BEE4